ncbi:hypothetical protein ACLOJK_033080 [Asimina triloba]
MIFIVSSADRVGQRLGTDPSGSAVGPQYPPRSCSLPRLRGGSEKTTTKRKIQSSMMDGWIRAVVEAVHASPTQGVLYLAGGASQALGWLLSAPGASNTVLEAVVPYSKISMSQLLGKIPTQFTSQQTVEEIALLAYNRALKLSRPDQAVFKNGIRFVFWTLLCRFYLSTRTSDRLWVSKVTLSKGLQTREQEDSISSRFLLKLGLRIENSMEIVTVTAYNK